MSYSRLEGDEQERKLFVGGINKQSTNEDVLTKYFESYGNIIDCTIMRDQAMTSRGFGFILFEDSTSVDKIMTAKKDGAEFSIDGRHIEIKRALPKVSGGNAGTSRTGGLNRKIFVGGLPSSITEEELRQYFEQYGRVNEVALLKDRETNRLRGFAFVTFDEEDSADKCIQRGSHEICKKICEVKRAQLRQNRDDGPGGRRPGQGGFDNRRDPRQPNQLNGAPGAPGSMNMTDVNQLIQQALVMGQQSVQPGLQVPTAASLMGGPTYYGGASAQPQSNVLLQALMGQQAAPPPPAPVAPTNTAALSQLAQLLQGSGVDANALAGLLKGNQQPAAAPAPEKAASGYSTAYPSVSSYDYAYNKTSNYGPSKDDGKRGYRPY